MDISINSIKVVGTSYGVRQQRIEALEEGEKVMLVPEPNNAYDPQAIAVKTFDGFHLGYLGRNDPRREEVRFALTTGFVVARACKTGGFTKRDGSKASWGLVVQYYTVDPFAIGDPGEKEEVDESVPMPRKGKHPTNRYDLNAAHKIDELRKMILCDNNPKRRRDYDRIEHHNFRRQFKAGADPKVIDRGWKYQYYTSDEWVRYAMKKWNKRMKTKISEEELLEMERKLYKSA